MRQLVSTLVTTYQVESAIRDVFVEGGTDVSTVSWFLEKHGHPRIAVKEVGGVEIPDASVQALGLEVGKRGRAFALCHEFERFGASELPNCPLIIVDRDFGQGLDLDIAGSRMMLVTDFCAVEAYALDPASLGSLLHLGLRVGSAGAEEIVGAVSSGLQHLYCLRLVMRQFGHELGDFERYLVIEDGIVVVRPERMLTSILGRNHELAMQLTGECFGQPVIDPRSRMYGHDIARVLLWYMRSTGIIREKEGWTWPALEAAMRVSIDAEVLSGYPMFRRLLGELSG